ncbi:DNA primase protein [Vibrio phage vB_VpS_PG28]|nr:DNA primase protein [Vibrio phage vB_VpS_PG28]
MNKANLVKFMQALGVDTPNTRRQGWVRGYCPLAPWRHQDYDPYNPSKKKDPNFGVKIDSTESHYYCFSCQSSGDLYSLIQELRTLNIRQPSGQVFDFSTCLQLIATEGDIDELNAELKDIMSSEGSGGLTEFAESYLESFGKAYDNAGNIHPYLASRKVSVDTARYFDIRYDPEKRRIIFPIRGFNGKLYGLHGRAIDKTNDLRYFAYEYLGTRNPSVWLNENNIDFDEPLVVTEGQFDVASISRVYENVIGSQTSALNLEKMKRIKRARTIVSFYDYGTGGDKAREYLDEYCAGKPISLHHVIPAKEIGDAGDMSEKQVYEYLVKHV